MGQEAGERPRPAVGRPVPTDDQAGATESMDDGLGHLSGQTPLVAGQLLPVVRVGCSRRIDPEHRDAEGGDVTQHRVHVGRSGSHRRGRHRPGLGRPEGVLESGGIGMR